MLLLTFIINYIKKKKKDFTKAFLTWIDLDIWYIHPLLEVSNLVSDSGPRIFQREYLQRVGIVDLTAGASGRGWAPEQHRGGTLHVGLLGPGRPPKHTESFWLLKPPRLFLLFQTAVT